MLYLLLLTQFYFGKNKVQYKEFSFLTYETENFDIYVEEGAEVLAYFAEKVLEEALEEYTQDFGIGIEEKIPVIIYSSPSDFSQTNIILEPIEESIGGFTELFKNRVVVPFTGSYKEFKHVLRHELTHVFQFELFFSLSLSNLFSLIPGFVPPLWFLEGMAEYCSEHGGEDAELFMRDLVINGEIVPLSELTPEYGFILYKEGESFFLYLENEYGRRKVFEFINAVKFKKSIEEASKYVFKKKFSEIEKDWMDYLKVKYFPSITLKKKFKANILKLTNHKKTGSIFNKSVSLSPTGTKIAFISDREDYTDIFVASAFDGKILKKLITTGRSASFEHLPVLKRELAWSEDERYLYVIAFSQGKPVLYVINYETAKIEHKLVLPLDDAFSPSVYKEKIVFIGLKDGYADIYQYDLSTKTLKRLTWDPFEEKSPFISDKGIFFVSDRPLKNEWSPGIYGLFLMKNNGEVKCLLHGLSTLDNPVIFNEMVYFIGPGKKLYGFSLKDSSTYEIFSSLATVEEISISNQGKMAITYFSGLGWDIGIFKRKVDKLQGKKVVLQKDTAQVFTFNTVDENDFSLYTPKFSPDYVYGTGSYSTDFGFSGWLYMGISDMLGNHRFYIDLYLSPDISFSNIVVEYWYLPHRWDIGIGAFQLVYFYYLLPNWDIILQRLRGGALFFSYPFSKFARVEAEIDGTYVDEFLYINTEHGFYYADHKEYPLFISGTAAVFDNILWKYYTPMRGTRWRIAVYKSFASPIEFTTFYVDFRHYLKLTPRSCLAIRVYGGESIDKDAEYFTLGGTGSVRGYNDYEEIGHKIVMMNWELRVPFIDYLKMAFPLPLTIKNLRGVLFIDAGICWNDTISYYDPATHTLGDIKIGYGVGLRFTFSYFLFKLDFGWPFYYCDTEDKNMKIHFSVGADF